MTNDQERDQLKQQLLQVQKDERQHWTDFERKAVECDQLKQQLADEKELVQGLEGNLAACEKELEETEAKLLASEASRERMIPLLRYAIPPQAANAAIQTHDWLRRRKQVLSESPQTALSEALKPVREARLCIQMVITRDEYALTQLGEVGKMVDRSSINMLKDALTQLGKLCPINPAPSRDCQSSSIEGSPMP